MENTGSLLFCCVTTWPVLKGLIWWILFPFFVKFHPCVLYSPKNSFLLSRKEFFLSCFQNCFHSTLCAPWKTSEVFHFKFFFRLEKRFFWVTKDRFKKLRQNQNIFFMLLRCKEIQRTLNSTMYVRKAYFNFNFVTHSFERL